jgi:hypothetical protein
VWPVNLSCHAGTPWQALISGTDGDTAGWIHLCYGMPAGSDTHKSPAEHGTGSRCGRSVPTADNPSTDCMQDSPSSKDLQYLTKKNM